MDNNITVNFALSPIIEQNFIIIFEAKSSIDCFVLSIYSSNVK
jgi:hypothetical protein